MRYYSHVWYNKFIMAANIEIQDDTGLALTSYNFGAVGGSEVEQTKFRIQNVGDTNATNVSLFFQRLNANDGIDYVSMAEDIAGNPGTFSTNVVTVGILTPGEIKYFWGRVAVLSGATPAGNPRQFAAVAQYTGT